MAGVSWTGDKKGLTLVEILIALAAISVISAGMVAAFISHNRVSAAEEARIKVQMNLRVAVDRLKNVLRHAGFGCYDSFDEDRTMYGVDPDNGTIEISSFISHVERHDIPGSDMKNDSLVLTHGFKKIGSVSEVLAKDRIMLDRDPSPSVTAGGEFKRYLSFFPSLHGNRYFQVKTVNGREVSFFEDLAGVRSGNKVFMVSPVRIKISQSSEEPVLFLQNFAYGSSLYWIIAEGIEHIRFQYYTGEQGWVDNPGKDSLQDIRKIRFWVLGKSSHPVRVHETQNLEIRDQQNQEVVYRAGPFDDGHVRMVSTGTVYLRNAIFTNRAEQK